jgi:hypothetical protein
VPGSGAKPMPSIRCKDMILKVLCTFASGVVVLILPVSSRAEAQSTTPTLLPRDYVRVTTTDKRRLIGHVLHSSIDSLIFVGDGAAYELGDAQIRRVDLGMGPTPWRAAQIGGLIGLAGGLAYGIIVVRSDDSSGDALYGLARALDLLFITLCGASGMMIGGATGLVVGLVHPSERWERIYPPQSILMRERSAAQARLQLGIRIPM